MPGRGPEMWRTACCCGSGRAEMTMLTLDDQGFAVGVEGLKKVFQQLHAMGRKPTAGVCDELLALVKARNYVPLSAEAQYKSALLREYAAFCASSELG